MAEVESEKLENFLNKATNPLNQSEDWDSIMAFCKQVNDELEGPQISVRLLAHKVQSPQEKEALYGLVVLEACVRNCGARFHQEIGKFRFLNEVIKVISPKYLGNYTKESVKRKCIELLYGWSTHLKSEPKILEAYSMLKQQGLIKKDPTYNDPGILPPPPPRKDTLFEDEEQSKLLAKLLKSKNPEDLQAANRLIKNKVKQDADRLDKAARRLQQLETTTTNIRLLNEMMIQYVPGVTGQSDEEVMKDLYDTLEKQRPVLFRLASDTEERDTDAIGQVLKVNDELVHILMKYQTVMEHRHKADVLLDSSGHGATSGSGGDTLLGLGDALLGGAAAAASDPWSEFTKPSTESSILTSAGAAAGIKASDSKPLNTNDPHGLGDIFGASPAPASSASSHLGNDLLGDSHFNGLSLAPTPGTGLGMASVPLLPLAASQSPALRPTLATSANRSLPLQPSTSQPRPAAAAAAGPSSPVHISWNSTPASSTLSGQTKPAAKPSGGRFDSLDELGKTVMQQAKNPAKTATNDGEALNGGGFGEMVEALPPVSKVTDVLPLTDVVVPLESIQPGTLGPVSAYDKHGVRVIIHVGKDRPRPDVQVMVVSTMSTNTCPVRKFAFQAAVPKTMKLKLQPASALDLPAYNPIMPPAAITQVMLIANPHKEKIRLKYKVTFTLDSGDITDTGDINDFPTLL